MKTKLAELEAQYKTLRDGGWDDPDHICLPMSELRLMLDVIQSAARITSLYRRELSNGFPITNEEHALTIAIHPLIHSSEPDHAINDEPTTYDGPDRRTPH